MKTLGWRPLLCVLGFVIFVAAMTGGGVRKFWRTTSVGRVVVLEGPSGLIVLTPVHRGSKGGLIGDAFEGPTDYLFRADVGPDGSLLSRKYRPKRYLALRLAEPGIVGSDLFLLEWPNSPEAKLVRFDPGGQIVAASPAESDAFRDPGPSPEWIRLKDHQSTRHAIAIDEETDGDHTRIVAISTLKQKPWRRVLVDVNTRRWYAYRRYNDLEDR